MSTTSRASSRVRMSGLNSGLDTEALVNAMTLNTKNRIDSLTKKKSLIETKQTMYRDIIKKVTDFKNKYFDVLKPNTYLKSTTLTSGYAAKLTGSNTSGLAVKTSTSSKAGNYTISSSQLATKSSWSSSTSNIDSTLNKGINVDLDRLHAFNEENNADADQEYSFSVSLGSTTQTVKFKLGEDKEATLANVNTALKQKFGTSNNGDAMVSLGSDGKLTTKSSVVLSAKEISGDMGIQTSTNSIFLNLNSTGATVKKSTEDGGADVEDRERSLYITSGGQTKKITVEWAVASDFLDDEGKLDPAKAGEAKTTAQAVFDENIKRLNEELAKNFTDGNGDPTVSVDSTGNLKATDGSAVSAKTYDGNFGLTKSSVTNKANNAATLADMAVTSNNEDGKYHLTLNGVDISFNLTDSVDNVMSTINNSKAGVSMTYSSINNSYKIESTRTGTTGTINVGSDDNGLFNKLGFNTNDIVAAKNAVVTINGEEMEVYSNSISYDGTTFNLSEGFSLGETYHVNIAHDYTNAINAVKSFVEDYNTLITDLNGLVRTKSSGYQPLTDEEKEEMTESQINKWEEKVKEGLLFSDQNITGMLSDMRSSLYSATKLSNGKTFGLYQMGISTSEDTTKHGALVIDEDALTKAFENYSSSINELFSGANGVFAKFDKVIDLNIHATGSTKGTLVRLAGLDTGTASLENQMKTQIDSYSTLINSLNKKYDSDQERYWKQFTDLETTMGKLNQQTAQMSSIIGG